jgi:hypothetical protein
MDNTELNHDRNLWRAVVNTIMNVWVPQNVVIFLSNCKAGGSSKRIHLNEVKLHV